MKSLHEYITETKKNNYAEAKKIWTARAEIQKSLEKGEYEVEADKDSVVLSGKVNGKDWTVEINLNPNDKHTPDINSENVVPYMGTLELFTSDTFNTASDDALEDVEKKYGFEIETIINVLGGGGEFPDKICDAIDAVTK